MHSTAALLLLILIRPGHLVSMKDRFYQFNERSCENLLKAPNYKEDVVANQAWREYYSWRSFSKKCHVTEFLKATSKMISRFAQDMKDFVLEQPSWGEATMLLKKGKYEMLMFPANGPSGKYKAIPNLAGFGDMYAFARHKVNFQTYAMKLLRNNKFLVMLDCREGIGLLLGRANDTVGENELLSVADEVGIGKGYLGCISFLKSYYRI